MGPTSTLPNSRPLSSKSQPASPLNNRASRALKKNLHPSGVGCQRASVRSGLMREVGGVVIAEKGEA